MLEWHFSPLGKDYGHFNISTFPKLYCEKGGEQSWNISCKVDGNVFWIIFKFHIIMWSWNDIFHLQVKRLWAFRRFQSHILIQQNEEMKLKYKVKGQKVYLILYITLQRIQISFILYQAIVISLTISQLLPPSKYTSHHHNQSIANCRFLTYKYGWPITGGRLWTWKDFHNYFEPTYVLSLLPFP
jgi:hypothetical protein